MMPFKGIFKYLIYTLIAVWMFFLGIIVGRGTSPVTFDTREFQKRLEIIANKSGEKKDTSKKMDLKFYDVLDRPVPEESVRSEIKALEIMPAQEIPGEKMPVKEIRNQETSENQTLEKETLAAPDIILPKTSRKKMTFKKMTFKKMTEKAKADIGENNPQEISQGQYTIQIAAYKEFKDAVSQMALLDEKGFFAYREKVEKNGIAWYRVRIGSFSSLDEAEKMKQKLNNASIKAQIVKKGS